MATRRKAKAKAKTKRKKTKATKAPARRKTTAAKKAAPRKRPAKKAPVKRTSAKRAKPAAKVAVRAAPPPASAPAPAAHVPPAPGEERVGVVTHYFSHLAVATVRLESGRLHLGDVIRIRGHTTDFTQRVESLEVNHAPTTDVGPNDDFGLKVVDHAREHDVVYKVH
jgi:Elongation factor Tu domain 2